MATGAFLPKQHPGKTRPAEFSWEELRGPASVHNWPLVNTVAPDSFIGHIRSRTRKAGFDLPTEAQWEYACRAGTTSRFNNGSDNDEAMRELGRFKWNQRWVEEIDKKSPRWKPDGKDYDGGYTSVGLYKPNAWGLYDMHGNVAEWCLDRRGNDRILRGGHWKWEAHSCTSSAQASNGPSKRRGGLRLVLRLE